MFFNGTICVTHLGIDDTGGLAGLSEGLGQPSGFTESDLSAYGNCDYMVVVPNEDFTSNGFEGGPFSPSSKTYTITNNGIDSFDWTVDKSASWLVLSTTGSTLTGSATDTVDIIIDAATANSLSPNTYTDTLTFTNITTGFEISHDVSLEILPIPGEIYVTDTILPDDDLNMPYGDVIVGVSRMEQITVNNIDATYELIISKIYLQSQFTEDFDDGLAQDWDEYEDDNWDVVANEYRAQETSGVSIFMQSMYTGHTWTDCLVQAQFRRTGYTGSSQVLLVRASDDFNSDQDIGSAYFFAISANGNYLVYKIISGVGTALQGWTSSPYLYPGTDSNIVSVDIEGSSINIYFNGYLAWSGTDSSIPGPGRIGVGGYNNGGDPTVHYFDDIQVGLPGTLGTGNEISAEQQWYNLHAQESVDIKMAPEDWIPAEYTGEKSLLDEGIELAAQVWELKNVPAMPVTVPASGSFTFDVVCQPDSLGPLNEKIIIESNDANESVVEVILSATGIPDDLEITPSEGLESYGEEGGPFTPNSKVYTLVNNGTASLDWTVMKTQNWLTLSATGGTLPGGATDTLLVSINVNANSLLSGIHIGSVTFTNTGSGLSIYRNVTLNVIGIASIPFFEDFEDPLELYWESTGTNTYRTERTTSWTPYMGSYHLTMDSDTDMSYSRNEMTLTIDLYNYEDVVLTFWMKEFGDENDGPPSSPFTGGADFDGVAISEDGTTWYEVQGLRDTDGISDFYTQFTVDLDSAIAAYGLTYNPAFRIRFNHYDNYMLSTDGFAFDDIAINAILKDDLEVSPEDIFTSFRSDGWSLYSFIKYLYTCQ